MPDFVELGPETVEQVVGICDQELWNPNALGSNHRRPINWLPTGFGTGRRGNHLTYERAAFRSADTTVVGAHPSRDAPRL